MSTEEDKEAIRNISSIKFDLDPFSGEKLSESSMKENMKHIRDTLSLENGLDILSETGKKLGYLNSPNLAWLISQTYNNIDFNTLSPHERSNILFLQQQKRVKFDDTLTAKLIDFHHKNIRYILQTYSADNVLNAVKSSDIENTYNSLFENNNDNSEDQKIDLNKLNSNEIHTLSTLILDKKIKLNEPLTNALTPEASKIQLEHERDLKYVKSLLEMGPPFMDESSLEEKYFSIITDAYKDVHSTDLVNKSYCEKMNLYSLYKVGKISLSDDLVTGIEKELHLVKTPKKPMKNLLNPVRRIKSKIKLKYNLNSSKMLINLIAQNTKSNHQLLCSALFSPYSPFKTSALLNKHHKNKIFSKFRNKTKNKTGKKKNENYDISIPSSSGPIRHR